jgi:hypothetical protein
MMTRIHEICFVGLLFSLLQGPSVSGQKGPREIPYLEDARSRQWCAFDTQSEWQAAVNNTRSMRVGTLIYPDGLLSEIHFNQEDEAGDYIVYDDYFVDARGSIVKLSRKINILPGRRSVVQVFSVMNGKAKKTGETATDLSTGEPLISPRPIWLPNLPIHTSIRAFPFSELVGKPGLTNSTKTCVRAQEN